MIREHNQIRWLFLPLVLPTQLPVLTCIPKILAKLWYWKQQEVPEYLKTLEAKGGSVMAKTAADVLVEGLIHWRVDTIFWSSRRRH